MDEIIQSVRDFNRFYVNLLGLLKNNVLDLDYSLTECRIVFEIDLHKDLTARKLKELLAIDEGYLSRLINNLVKDQIISKTQSETDKRVYHLHVTEKGKNLLNVVNDKSNNQIHDLLQYLKPNDQLRVAEIMSELKHILSNTKFL